MKSLLSLALLFSLSAPTEVARGESHHVIGGNKVERSTRPEIVFMQIGNSSCSATIVGPNVILTAAHCVGLFDRTATFFVGRKRYEARLYKSDDYWLLDRTHDLAVGIVDREIEDVPPAAIGGEARSGIPITIYGFGCGGPTGRQPVGVLRRGENEIGSVRGHTFTYRNRERARPGDGDLTCSGDSGGPSFARTREGREVLIGVHSRGDSKTISIDVRTDHYETKRFLEAFAREHGVEICGITDGC